MNTTIGEIQKKLLEKLTKLVHLLESNDIKYSIEAGTAIGAIRHHGFIPWDDDIDLTIPESEIEKFKKTIENTNGMTLRNYKNKTSHAFFKVFFEDTFVLNGRQKSYIKIDVFVLYKEREFSWWSNFMRVVIMGYIDFKTFAPTRYFSKMFPFTKKWLQKRFIKLIQKQKIKNENIGYLYDSENFWNTNNYLRYFYWKTEKIKFENIEVNIYLNAIDSLNEKYGDIMIEPDEKDRKIHGTKLYKKPK